MADFRINVIVDPGPASRGLGQVRNELNRTETLASRAANNINRLLALTGVSVGISQIIALADAATVLDNRVRVAQNGIGDIAGTLDELTDIANRTRTPVEQLTGLFQRATIASRELGASQSDIFTFVEATAQALAIQGGATAESAGALVQLSQALGNANIQAQEFNSLVDGAFPLLQAAAAGIERTGGSVSQLRQEVLAGNLTNIEFFNAIIENTDLLEERFEQTNATIGQSFTILRNRLVELIGDTQPLDGLADIIITISENLELAARVAIAAGIAYGANLVLGVNLATTAIGSFTVALLANPLTALPALIVGATAVLIAFSDQVSLTGSETSTLQDEAQAAFNVISRGFNASITAANTFVSTLVNDVTPSFNILRNQATSAFEALPESARNSLRDVGGEFDGVASFAARSVDLQLALFTGLFNSIVVTFSNLPAFFLEIGNRAVNGLAGIIETGVNEIINLINVPLQALDINLIDPVEVQRTGRENTTILTDVGEDIINGFVTGIENTGPATRALEAFFNELETVTSARLENSLDELIDRDFAAEIEREAQRLQELSGGFGFTPAINTDAEDILDRYNRALEQNLELSQSSGVEQQALQELQRLENALLREGITLSAARRVELLADTEANIAAVQASERRAEILDRLNGPQETFAQQLFALRQLLDSGAISADQFTDELVQLQLTLNSATQGTTFADGFNRQIAIMADSGRNFTATFGSQVATIFGPGGTLIQGIGDATARAILFEETFSDGLRSVARTIVSTLISSLVQVGIQMGINAALGSSLSTAATAQSVSQAATVNAAWTPAAATTSLASFGTNSVAAIAGIAAVLALTNSIGGFATGGFVSGPGTGTSDSILARLSNGEFVMPAAQTSQFLPMLEAMRSGSLPGFQTGGSVGQVTQAVVRSAPSSNNGTPGVQIINNTQTPINNVETEQLDDGRIRVIINEELDRQTPGRVAREFTNDYSPSNRALSQRFRLERR